MTEATLTMSNGQMVQKGEVAVSDFLKKVIAKSDENRRYSGTLEDLAALTKLNLENFAQGIGSEGKSPEDCDVRLVYVPVENFYTNIVPITEDNADQIRVKWEPRIDGEAPVSKMVIISDELVPADVVRIVTYRADVLAKDDDRSSDAEWEIVGVLAEPAHDSYIPMHPTTMTRNTMNLPGGTKREYSIEEWINSAFFWANHVYLEAPEETGV